ncbi:MAG: hypothetical protein AAGB16_10210, partial [Pseudomonadota bacterium]
MNETIANPADDAANPAASPKPLTFPQRLWRDLKKHLNGGYNQAVILTDIWTLHCQMFVIIFILWGIEKIIGWQPGPILVLILMGIVATYSALMIWALVRTHMRYGPPRTRKNILSAIGVIVLAGAPLVYLADAFAAKARTTVEDFSGTYRVTSKDGVLYLFGGINPDMYDAFMAEVEAYGDAIRTVEIESTGGRVRSAQKIAAELYDREWSTRVITRCESACLTIFAAGEARYAGTYAAFGCHRGSKFGLADREIESGFG